MGTWSIKIFDNDTALDIKETYIEFLKNQYSDEEAYELTHQEFNELMGTDEEPLFWYAIAYIQWENGRLMPKVKQKAIFWIERNGGLEIWDIKKANKWKSNLIELKRKLNSPMPFKKIYKKAAEFTTNPWDVGDVYAYQFHTKKAKEVGLFGKYILFQKIGDCEYYANKKYTIVKIYNNIFDHIPDINAIKDCDILPLTYPLKKNGFLMSENEYIPSFEWYLQAIMLYEKKNCYPKNHFVFVGNMNYKPINLEGNESTDFYWEKDNMESWLIEYYFSWK